jgi:hypothetical protein
MLTVLVSLLERGSQAGEFASAGVDPIRWSLVTEHEDAIRNAGDPNRLLPDENPQTLQPEDARHWRNVYGELLRFKEGLLSVADRGLADLEQELKVTDSSTLALLRAQNNRLRHRLEFWERRHRELTAR